ncbi:MAG: c-type cytochrome biogenesis protein CcsB [Syntrophobacteraceae bacterium]|jgi:cytochrome c-type biogenesis protein CcsB|nr:c-type cytochrome biogenesis protein CcsB [Syntrophobacteraceae bacterium]
METALLIATTLFYLFGTVGYMIYLFKEEDPLHRTAWGVLLVGVLAHIVAIVARSVQVGHLAVSNSAEALSFFALILVSTYLFAQIRFQIRILGAFVSPIAVLFMLGSSLLPADIVPRTGLIKSAWVTLHVALLFSANALFAIAFSAGVMYLLQERHIKKKRIGHLYLRLPSLERLDRINYVCIVIGFPLMTLGLVLGFAYAGTVWPSLWSWDPKEIFAVVTWVIYAVLLHERLAVGWRGRRAAWLAIFGFSAVLVTFLGVNLFMEGHHAANIR